MVPMGRETDMDFHVGGVEKQWRRHCSADLFADDSLLHIVTDGGGGGGVCV